MYTTEKPDLDYLAHYGVKGMRWGVRKDRKIDAPKRKTYSIKTKSGETLTMRPYKQTALSKVLRKIPSLREEQDKSLGYDVFNSEGKKVSTFQGYLKDPEEFNIVWVDTNDNYRGKGYMQAVLKQGEQIAREYGRTKITAELVGNSPDIHHIVLDKMNFTKVGEDRTKEVLEVWGGLTLVEKNLR